MKKSLKMLLALVATVSLVGCSSKNESNDAQPTDTPTSTEVSTETNVEVAEIDVDNLSAVEIYDLIVENTENLISVDMDAADKGIEYTGGSVIFTPKNGNRLVDAARLSQLSYNSIESLYGDGKNGSELGETGIDNGASILVIKAKDGEIENLKKGLDVVYSQLLEETQVTIENLSADGSGALDHIIDNEKMILDNSGYVIVNNTVIACCATNGMDVLNSLFDNVQPMFSGR